MKSIPVQPPTRPSRIKWRPQPINGEAPHCYLAQRSCIPRDSILRRRSPGVDVEGEVRAGWRPKPRSRFFTFGTGPITSPPVADTVYEDSRLPLKHWCYAFWRACSSKKGVSALEIQRHCQISYKSALFLMHRIRFAMAPEPNAPKMTGTIEADETYVGGKPRKGSGPTYYGRSTRKTPVFALVQRDGEIRRKVVANVSGASLRTAIREHVCPTARMITDDFRSYWGLVREFQGGHEIVKHTKGEYARGDIHTNTAESSFALLKRGLTGIYHAVSKRHLHRYVSEFDFRWNARRLNDGERTALAIRSASGKRLTYEAPLDNNSHS